MPRVGIIIGIGVIPFAKMERPLPSWLAVITFSFCYDRRSRSAEPFRRFQPVNQMASTTHMDYYATPTHKDYYDSDDPSRNVKRGQSGFGIASFVIACLAGMFELAVIVYAGILQTSTPGGMDENSPQAIVIGLAAIGGMAIDLLAIGLGIAGLFQRGRGKTFAVLGVVLGTVILLGMIGLIILGLAMGGQ
jgi:hypothetical protein